MYSAAKFRCETLMNGVLAKIDNHADYDEVAAMISAASYPIKQAWIGLNDISTEGTFRYVEDDSALGDFQPWCSPNPSNHNGNEDCVVMNGDNPGCAGGMWWDVSCSACKYMAVCRVPNTAQPSSLAPTMPINAPTTPTIAPSLGPFRLELLKHAVPFIYSAAKFR
jgi:hypothetical protein